MNKRLKEKLFICGTMLTLATSVAFLGNSAITAYAEETVKTEVKTEEVKTEEVQKAENQQAKEGNAEANKNQQQNNANVTEQKPSTKEIEQKIRVEAPSSVTGQKTEGQGTVTDFTTNNSKNFFTIQDKEGNVYYLIIDMEKTENNVYFVSDVSRSSLETSGNQNNQQNTNQQVNNQQTNQPMENQQVNNQQTINAQQPKKDENNSNFLMVVLVGFVALVGGYYFLVFKKKKGKTTDNGNDEMEFEENLDDDFLGEENEGE